MCPCMYSEWLLSVGRCELIRCSTALCYEGVTNPEFGRYERIASTMSRSRRRHQLKEGGLHPPKNALLTLIGQHTTLYEWILSCTRAGDCSPHPNLSRMAITDLEGLSQAPGKTRCSIHLLRSRRVYIQFPAAPETKRSFHHVP